MPNPKIQPDILNASGKLSNPTPIMALIELKIDWGSVLCPSTVYTSLSPCLTSLIRIGCSSPNAGSSSFTSCAASIPPNDGRERLLAPPPPIVPYCVYDPKLPTTDGDDKCGGTAKILDRLEGVAPNAPAISASRAFRSRARKSSVVDADVAAWLDGPVPASLRCCRSRPDCGTERPSMTERPYSISSPDCSLA